MRISIGSAGEVFFPLIRATVPGGMGASCFGYPDAACTACPIRAAAIRARTRRCAHLSMKITGDFRLRGTKGTDRASNRADLLFAGNCGNKWLDLDSENPMKRVGDDKDPR